MNRCDGSVGGRDVDRNPVEYGECVTSWYGCKQQQVELQLLSDGVESHVWSLPTNGGAYLHGKWSGRGMAGGGSTKTIVTDIFTGDQSCAAGGSLGNKDGSWNAVDFSVVKAQSNNRSAEWRRLRQGGRNCGRGLSKINRSGGFPNSPLNIINGYFFQKLNLFIKFQFEYYFFISTVL